MCPSDDITLVQAGLGNTDQALNGLIRLMKSVLASCPHFVLTGALLIYIPIPDVKTCSGALAFPHEKAESSGEYSP
jgi:hypothetical protein